MQYTSIIIVQSLDLLAVVIHTLSETSFYVIFTCLCIHCVGYILREINLAICDKAGCILDVFT